ncbi:septum formation family protein [Herbiconiux sp. SYSU D00978]|uniref:septum formation family protein n=1 Tax=Herbiconiux sp. SYSU D00978 TaxID=2812562 RepID=UPI001A964E43|nr:septum formation family protein [Herbiconiux sp. SYSU D00978]
MNPRGATKALTPLFMIGAVAALLTGCAQLPQVDEEAAGESATPSASPSESAAPDDGGTTTVNVNELTVGDCWSGATEGEIFEVELIDCAQPHQSEAFHAVQAPDGEYPTEDVFAQLAFDECAGDVFTQYTGQAYDPAANLQVYYYAPLADGWEQGDREVLCYLANLDGSLLQGS